MKLSLPFLALALSFGCADCDVSEDPLDASLSDAGEDSGTFADMGSPEARLRTAILLRAGMSSARARAFGRDGDEDWGVVGFTEAWVGTEMAAGTGDVFYRGSLGGDLLWKSYSGATLQARSTQNWWLTLEPGASIDGVTRSEKSVERWNLDDSTDHWSAPESVVFEIAATLPSGEAWFLVRARGEPATLGEMSLSPDDSALVRFGADGIERVSVISSGSISPRRMVALSTDRVLINAFPDAGTIYGEPVTEGQKLVLLDTSTETATSWPVDGDVVSLVRTESGVRAILDATRATAALGAHDYAEGSHVLVEWDGIGDPPAGHELPLNPAEVDDGVYLPRVRVPAQPATALSPETVVGEPTDTTIAAVVDESWDVTLAVTANVSPIAWTSRRGSSLFVITEIAEPTRVAGIEVAPSDDVRAAAFEISLVDGAVLRWTTLDRGTATDVAYISGTPRTADDFYVAYSGAGEPDGWFELVDWTTGDALGRVAVEEVGTDCTGGALFMQPIAAVAPSDTSEVFALAAGCESEGHSVMLGSQRLDFTTNDSFMLVQVSVE